MEEKEDVVEISQTEWNLLMRDFGDLLAITSVHRCPVCNRFVQNGFVHSSCSN